LAASDSGEVVIACRDVDNVVPLTLVPQVVDPESPAATNEDTPVSAAIARSASTDVNAGATVRW
jgi:hypothetical protein